MSVPQRTRRGLIIQRHTCTRLCPRVLQPPIVATFAAEDHSFRPTARGDRTGGHIPHPNWLGAMLRDTQADVPSAKRLWAQLAFKNSMVRGILQFTPSIAFRCVLHRCESRDIRCRESFFLRKDDNILSEIPKPGSVRCAFFFNSCFPWRVLRRGWLID